jgi:hypothetical protein
MGIERRRIVKWLAKVLTSFELVKYQFEEPWFDGGPVKIWTRWMINKR